MNNPFLYMVFDVESIGLHGEAFAVAWVLVTRDGEEIEHRVHSCPPSKAAGWPDGRDWVMNHVPELEPNCMNPRQVRDSFWRDWQWAQRRGAALAADVPWPVEARFLAQCVADDSPLREWDGPYPLLCIASIRFAAGRDPTGVVARHEHEQPEHSPLADARQSARLLVEALNTLGR